MCVCVCASVREARHRAQQPASNRKLSRTGGRGAAALLMHRTEWACPNRPSLHAACLNCSPRTARQKSFPAEPMSWNSSLTPRTPNSTPSATFTTPSRICGVLYEGQRGGGQ